MLVEKANSSELHQKLKQSQPSSKDCKKLDDREVEVCFKFNVFFLGIFWAIFIKSYLISKENFFYFLCVLWFSFGIGHKFFF
ncbi:unnamed protein product [Meloidogyne enterolobii]|uniref:Uncharacterized protein n=1 Tax=Meloidogyne enterolobii TaxID=390850 RepID=A0ACB1AZR0_MELEN